MHSFRALSEKVVFLDIIGPPYNDDERNCTYYSDMTEIPGSSIQPVCIDESISIDSLEKLTLENGVAIPVNADTIVWILEDDIEYECFSKYYEPHQT